MADIGLISDQILPTVRRTSFSSLTRALWGAYSYYHVHQASELLGAFPEENHLGYSRNIKSLTVQPQWDSATTTTTDLYKSYVLMLIPS